MHKNITYLLIINITLFISINCSQYCNSSGCFNCYYRCQACSSFMDNQCTSCTQNYLFGNGSCMPCTQNCISCAAGQC